jgi:hypothetical protein
MMLPYITELAITFQLIRLDSIFMVLAQLVMGSRENGVVTLLMVRGLMQMMLIKEPSTASELIEVSFNSVL